MATFDVLPLPSARARLDPVSAEPVLSAELSRELERVRPLLVGHCYRMLGSVVDAEDAVQDTLLRAWRALDRFEARASLRTWLTRIATRVCLDRLASSRRRRLRPVDLPDAPVAAEAIGDALALARRPREHWVEPIPDVLVLPAADDAGPEERAILRESVRLAFVAALQYLPPRQRAALLLTQVLGWSAAEAAGALGMSVAAINSALQRARATLLARNPAVVPRSLTGAQDALLARYVAAFEAYDVVALTALLHEEATMSMPPYGLWLQGPAAIARWLVTVGRGCEGSRLVPVAASGQPAFAQYRRVVATSAEASGTRAGGYSAWGLVLVGLGPADEPAGGDAPHGAAARITSLTTFLDVETLFPRFALPLTLPATDAPETRPHGLAADGADRER